MEVTTWMAMITKVMTRVATAMKVTTGLAVRKVKTTARKASATVDQTTAMMVIMTKPRRTLQRPATSPRSARALMPRLSPRLHVAAAGREFKVEDISTR